MFHFLAKFAVLRFRRHLQTLAVNVEQPAVVSTAQSAVFDVTVFQRRAAMRTVLAEESNFAELIAKQNQIFTENFDRLRNIVKLLRGSDDDPITAKPFAAGSSRSDARNIRNRHALFSLRAYFRH